MHHFLKVMIIWSLLASHSFAQEAFDKKIQHNFDKYYTKFKAQEYFSGAALSIYVPGKPIKNYFIGQVSHDRDSAKVSMQTLFQIGSITKSFTAAIILQLEKENKLRLIDTLHDLIPTYAKWHDMNVKALLNMTSGLPNYSDAPLWNAKLYENVDKIWSGEELISYVYPVADFNPPLKAGYFYTNTGYILLSLMVEKITHHRFSDELVTRTINRAQLTNTFYMLPSLTADVEGRLAHGYNFNQYDNPSLVGRDVYKINLSWAQAAGGVIANAEDIIKWVQALFVGDKILDAEQKRKLMSLISVEDGSPIATTNQTHPRGFGLGVVQSFDPKIGQYWFYEGETLGYRALYMYIPCNQIIISAIFNSATNSENDHAGELMKTTYDLILSQYPALRKKC